MSHFALAIGIGTQNNNGDWLEVFYPQPLLHPSDALVKAFQDALDLNSENTVAAVSAEHLGRLTQNLEAADDAELTAVVAQLHDSKKPLVAVLLPEDSAPKSVPEAYLKLHLLSHRLVKPHGTSLDGMFGVLHNVAWTNQGAIDLAELPARQMEARLKGKTLSIDCVDKFPKMTDYVVPAGVRIADTARVRLGAYLGEGTTIMHEGFVNFNAGTEGPGMIEGRISAGVMIGSGSDLGGGCSTMGTLSGGGNIIISVGDACLLGANSGIGIPLGDRCTIEAGLYITAGTKVNLMDDSGTVVKTIKARDLAGQSDLLFRRNSETGAVQCKTNRSAIELNEALHSN